ncbi:flagellar hook-basal body protein FliE [Roseivivax sp. THAF40]|uniref:flagellar hook-basal body complex protein FliE n=1 Tax=Roseivivax sp. THAF40 TaxID=2587858 RepID=UPI0012678DD1|nr:flagellar hook-basal body complex protein FliE [Roseivivax sp. THAF40]QFT47368.1 flagellar hook-basal body protein FliE [Roseivivax sp. THAF40]
MSDPVFSTNAALGAYRTLQKMPAAAPEADAAQAVGNDFAKVLAEAGSSVISEAQDAESVMASGLAGGHSTQDIVQATLELEQTVQLAVSVRDKLVEAYQDIMRMPI